MSLILINGSPRKNGNSQYITDFIISILERESVQYELVDVKNMDIAYCTGCGACEKTGWCVIKDQGSRLHKQFDESNGTIIISPIYFNSLTAQVKTVIDRMQAIYSSKYALKKPTFERNKDRYGAFIAVGGSPPYEEQFVGAKFIIDMFFKVINTKWLGTVLINDTDSKHISERDDELKHIEATVMDIVNKLH